MAEQQFGKIKRFRDHAEELRTMAQNWRDPETLQTVLELANDYDRMAETLESIDAKKRH